MKKSQNTFDIIIVGAGLVGMSVIVALREAGFRILVLEKHLPSIIDMNKEDYRPLSLAYGSQRCLDRWGVWSSLTTKAMPIKTLHVSEQGRFGRVQFSAEDYDLSALGYVVPFSLLQRTLYENASSQSNVTFVSIEKIKTMVCDEKGAELEYIAANESHRIFSTLLIAADGAHSTCRELLRIPVETYKADDVAWIASFHCHQAHQSMAYQRFTKQGSLALLPLFDPYQYRLVWTMPQCFYETIKADSDEKLLARIKAVYEARLGTLSDLQRDAVFPLQMIVAHETIRPSLVLLGNAAQTLYPIAAQNFNLSVQNIEVLTRVLMRAKQQDESIGALPVLERYANRRQKNQQAVVQWTLRIVNAFRWKMPLLDHTRGIALLCLDTLPYVKDNFARKFLYV